MQKIAWSIVFAFTGIALPCIAAEDFPTKPIRLLVPFAPGGGADIVARLLAPGLTARLGQPVIVDNRPAAAGIVAAEMAARATPDGHTLFVATSNHVANPAFMDKLPYDTLNDFAPVTLAVISPLVVTIHPSLPANNLQEFINYARANPGKLNYGSTGAGGPPYLAVELLNYMAKIKITHIVYKGISLVVTANLSNEIQVSTPNLFTGLPHVRGGRLRALGITSVKRSAVAPELPTIAEAGLPGYEASIWYGFLAPAKMPQPVIARLNREISSVLQAADVRQTIVSQGGEAVGGTPAEFGKLLRDDVARIAALVKTAGLRAEQ
jgi:tripartite-type tricarboxylate transporter receptor subunit TctC